MARMRDGATTDDYRNACSGEGEFGPLGYEWSDKPHRLVYDLCGEIDHLIKLLRERDDFLVREGLFRKFTEQLPPTIGDTIAFIQKAHAGQLDKGGNPYWLHPVAVMNLLPTDATDDERHAALLHDVLEDTNTTAEDLHRMGYSEATIEIVQLVTRPTVEPRLTYMEWIRSIAASGNKGAIRVKLADNKHNSDPVRAAQLPPHERGIERRYARSMSILEEALVGL